MFPHTFPDSPFPHLLCHPSPCLALVSSLPSFLCSSLLSLRSWIIPLFISRLKLSSAPLEAGSGCSSQGMLSGSLLTADTNCSHPLHSSTSTIRSLTSLPLLSSSPHSLLVPVVWLNGIQAIRVETAVEWCRVQ